MLGELGKELWKVRELVFFAFTPWAKKCLETSSWALWHQFTRWSHKIEGTSGAALWLKDHGMRTSGLLKHTHLCAHQNHNASPPLRARTWATAMAFLFSLSRSSGTLCQPTKQLPMTEFEEQCLVLAHQKAGDVWAGISGVCPWGSPFLSTLQKCSPGQPFCMGNYSTCQPPLIWEFTLWGKRSKGVHRGAWRDQGQICLNF